jgi:hypothetical protein
MRESSLIGVGSSRPAISIRIERKGALHNRARAAHGRGAGAVYSHGGGSEP